GSSDNNGAGHVLACSRPHRRAQSTDGHDGNCKQADRRTGRAGARRQPLPPQAANRAIHVRPSGRHRAPGQAGTTALSVTVPADAKRRAGELARELTDLARAYYIDADPKVADVEYDRLFRELEALEE